MITYVLVVALIAIAAAVWITLTPDPIHPDEMLGFEDER